TKQYAIGNRLHEPAAKFAIIWGATRGCPVVDDSSHGSDCWIKWKGHVRTEG
ncbi:hypothetical protein TRIATDRAFT_255230, partial [Trichoderma atroviride IMI 206040]